MRVVRWALWSVLVLVGAVAAAGLVVSLDHPVSGGARPELTARDAAILAPRLAAIDAPLERLAGAARSMSGAGREVLVQLRALDVAAVAAALTAGDLALGAMTEAAAEARAVGTGLLDGLGVGDGLPAADRERVAAIGSALDAVDGLADAWSDVARASVAPTALLTALRAHDAAVVRAAELGRGEQYPRALAALADAAAALAEATDVRDAADRAGRDMALLDGWLVRLTDYDAALVALYRELRASGSVRTPVVEAALAAVTAAQAALPETQDGLVIAITDIGAADVTPALLTIEDGRGAIEAALGSAQE